MQTTLFEPGQPREPGVRDRLDSNTVARLDGVTGFADVREALTALRATYPDARLLCTYDDPDQCAYTSMHATLVLEQAAEQAEDYDFDDPVAVHRAENATLAHIAALLDAPDRRVDWPSLAGSRAATDADLDDLVRLNSSPDKALDATVLVQRVPVERDDLALAGIPNGYFADDWNIFTNHAVVRRMAGHGYRHLAIGAALLAFDRPTAPSAAEAAAVVSDLVHLYGLPDAIAWHELAVLLPARDMLVLGYAEDFGSALDLEQP
ncbi:hypothetical protein ACFXK0_16035 [Nocardia sp. NPDC059177]|uniref:hypothetical protein n=1 Tax=Nocardia sp. NPDC059177 TaxID=3346759 RepID=UPI0036994E51